MRHRIANALGACFMASWLLLFVTAPRAQEIASGGADRVKPDDQTDPSALKAKPPYPSSGFQFGMAIMSGGYMKPFRDAASGPSLVIGTDHLAGLEIAYASGILRYALTMAPSGVRVQSDRWGGSDLDPGAFIGHGVFLSFQVWRIAMNAGLPDYNWTYDKWGDRMNWKETSFGLSWVPIRLPWWW